MSSIVSSNRCQFGQLASTEAGKANDEAIRLRHTGSYLESVAAEDRAAILGAACRACVLCDSGGYRFAASNERPCGMSKEAVALLGGIAASTLSAADLTEETGSTKPAPVEPAIILPDTTVPVQIAAETLPQTV